MSQIAMTGYGSGRNFVKIECLFRVGSASSRLSDAAVHPRSCRGCRLTPASDCCRRTLIFSRRSANVRFQGGPVVRLENRHGLLWVEPSRTATGLGNAAQCRHSAGSPKFNFWDTAMSPRPDPSAGRSSRRLKACDRPSGAIQPRLAFCRIGVTREAAGTYPVGGAGVGELPQSRAASALLPIDSGAAHSTAPLFCTLSTNRGRRSTAHTFAGPLNQNLPIPRTPTKVPTFNTQPKCWRALRSIAAEQGATGKQATQRRIRGEPMTRRTAIAVLRRHGGVCRTPLRSRSLPVQCTFRGRQDRTADRFRQPHHAALPRLKLSGIR